MAIILNFDGIPIDQTYHVFRSFPHHGPYVVQHPLEEAMVSFDNFNVYFSPGGGARAALKALIDAAVTSIKVLAYELTDLVIADALVAAVGRAVSVTVVLDGGESKFHFSDASFLKSHGVSVFIDNSHRIMHDKVMIIDATWVTTGSYNFTNPADTANAENLVVMKPDAGVVAAYSDNFDLHHGHSVAY